MFPIFLMLLIFIMGIVTIKVWKQNQAQQKTSNLQNIAQVMGWTVENNGRQTLYGQLSRFEVFKRGDWKDIQGVLAGRLENVDFRIVSFRHGSMTGIPTEYLILFIEDAEQNLPTLAFRHKKAGFILRDSVTPLQFDAYPSLKQNYVLQSDAPETLMTILRPNLLNALAYTVQNHYLLEVEMAAAQFLCYQHLKGEEEIKAATVQNLALHGIQIYRQI